VAAFGEGTAATACHAAAALAAPHLRLPFWVGDGATVPAFVDEHTLVFAVSCAEGTDAVGAAQEAVARRARVVAVGSDGELAAVAATAGLPWCPVTPGGPLARSALGGATVPLLSALAGAALAPDPTASVHAAATDEVMADVFEVEGEGDDDLGRFFDLALLGELVSLHLAGREGVDPGPVPAVDDVHLPGGVGRS
jgi:hypothetical protein